MVSTLGYALLGLLAREPLSGYELAQRLKEPVGFIWNARHSQIYPELARLEAAGLVTHEAVEQRDRPDKKVYQPTERGRQALAEWVTEPLDLVPVRDELVLRAFSVWLAEPLAAAHVFEDQALRHRQRLEHFESIAATIESRAGDALADPTTTTFATYATLRRGIAYEREYAEWCAWMAAQLRGDGQTSERGE